MRSYVAEPGNKNAATTLAEYHLGAVVMWGLSFFVPLFFCLQLFLEASSTNLASNPAALALGLCILLFAGGGVAFVVVWASERILGKLLLVDELGSSILLLDPEVKRLSAFHKFSNDQKFELQALRNKVSRHAQNEWLSSKNL